MLTLGSAMDCALQETPELAGPREAPSPGGDVPRGIWSQSLPLPTARREPSPVLCHETGPWDGFSMLFGRTGAVWGRLSLLCWMGPAQLVALDLTMGRATLTPHAFTRWGSSSSSWPTQSPHG